MVASIGNRCPNFDFQIALSYFISDFDSVCGRLHGLIRACMSDSHAYKVAVPFKDISIFSSGSHVVQPS